ncbi:metallophosphoesterase [filamentous cyanobacterium CCP1]|nr:metallophosphoesterase [filamentous cyanobacterium CCP2]PSB63869.1 metallophosphoesterase [filamentous cyanobacterium CCP1]
MPSSFRFAVISDPHIALPQTIWDHPSRFHLVEISIPAIELVLEQIAPLDIDFLLLPGDLTQHGEPENHRWLSERLAQLPYPVCVVPGNHDVPEYLATDRSIGLSDFALYYEQFGYSDPAQPYYLCEVIPGVQVIGLNSNFFDPAGKQINMGRVDDQQLDWLKNTLAEVKDDVVMVMIHHNVIEHLPGQAKNPLGRRYMLENASTLLEVLNTAEVKLLFTGHLHVQDVARHQSIYEITTGSLVSYPHPYRVLEFQQDYQGNQSVRVESGRVTEVPGWANLPHFSREWIGDRSFPFMLRLLTQPPLNLPVHEAEKLAPMLRYFWADIAEGDAVFHFPSFPPELNHYFKQFGAIDQNGELQRIDNFTLLTLQ